MTEEEILRKLIGTELASVEFVRDYVQLRFDGPTLTLTSEVQIHCNGSVYQLGRKGFCDAVCSAISTSVVEATIKKDLELILVFANQISLAASLRSKDYHGPEAVRYDDGQVWWVI